MKYLLIMPRDASRGTSLSIFPIGLAYVSSSMKNAGHDVYTVNLEYQEGDIFSILQELIRQLSIDVICTSGLSLDYKKILDVLESVRKHDPSIITVVGGGIISSDPVTAMRVLNADIGIIGQGEITMCELAHALDTGSSYSDIPGIIYREKDDTLTITSQREEISDLDCISFPDFDGFHYAKWTECSGYGVVTCSRSCPLACTFCFHPSGQKYRQRSLYNIFKEIDYQVEHFRLKEISLIDELFATKRDRVMEFCRRIKPYNLSWSLCLRVCDVDVEMLVEMKKSGCRSISYGLESADDSILKSMRKGITVDQIERALNNTYEANINVFSNFIFGDINETPATVSNTIHFWEKHLGRDYINLDLISSYPGTYLYKYACDAGIISDKEQFLKDGCPVVNVSKLSNEEYLDLQSLITELRLKPHVACRSLRVLDVRSNGNCSIEFECRKCGEVNYTDLFFWYNGIYTCSSCGLLNGVDPIEIAQCREDVMSSVLPATGNIGLWGAGGIYYKLMQKYSLFTSERYLLIDADKRLQGMSICNKKIYSPDEIAANNVQAVIIMALSRKDEIYDTICKKYPSVERIFVPVFDIQNEGLVPSMRLFGS
ncbi:MAG: cobalamin B12-binding domain-containing protein [Desulfuromonadales bacterium]|nr:cobalamin B12-binding domain-containing protein [Desulfuromonadales bacterium]